MDRKPRHILGFQVAICRLFSLRSPQALGHHRFLADIAFAIYFPKPRHPSKEACFVLGPCGQKAAACHLKLRFFVYLLSCSHNVGPRSNKSRHSTRFQSHRPFNPSTLPWPQKRASPYGCQVGPPQSQYLGFLLGVAESLGVSAQIGFGGESAPGISRGFVPEIR